MMLLMLGPLSTLVLILVGVIYLLSAWYPAYAFLVWPVFYTTTLTYIVAALARARSA